jgi:hypothetical protein
MKTVADLTKIEAGAWVAHQLSQCITPEQRFQRAQVERELVRRYAEHGIDRMVPNATRARRDLIAALEVG